LHYGMGAGPMLFAAITFGLLLGSVLWTVNVWKKPKLSEPINSVIS
jgi:hypothetical protein